MTTTTPTDVRDVPPLGHAEAARLQLEEHTRFLDVLRELAPDDWDRTVGDCPAWTVRDMATHVLATLEASASIRENLHQLRRARRRSEPLADAISAVQVGDRAALAPAEVLARLDAAIPKGVAARRRLPAPIRHGVRTKVPMPWGTERWRLGYLLDTIYLRDVWMHRIDLSRTVGRPLRLTPEHDGRIVADVVAEWARRHGQPFHLVAGGPAGGAYVQGTGGDDLTVDAVDLCRTLSGREPGSGLLTTEVPF